uniref:Uncharacterized protein n=1 Tax=Pseudictyota dubia TaxID=2749911 RepID=A0A7R9ZEQ1_9STRA|mmetsp:Transcript_46508/g.86403  ORF Transcript_46508/g.86403 Transcript_46508/m.86403 type:complete len:264 (+) Transcript_46508:139-930(+)|eukprot:CAMPEP_0197448778 /NCGR_PEP_ID=MMETSP1175-20131217/18923_1 /TAXON_ID=1003142 /ORGANISM="Triceratium dubium, Strain CCMP147" /LENGTH=263 /DNA_ID=CAMNT_0042980671 /DNA_START=131 /DNA_END=922 /DNA_ORIENTATION=+
MIPRRLYPSCPLSVRFSANLEVAIIPALEELSDSEKSSIWYSEIEMREIKDGCHEAVRKMRAGRVVNTGKSEPYTTRGLERLGSYLHHSCTLKKRRVINEVLREQHRQRKMRTFNPQVLSVISARHSRCAVTLARSRGASDAVVYYDLKKEENQLCLSCCIHPVAGELKSSLTCIQSSSQGESFCQKNNVQSCLPCQQQPVPADIITKLATLETVTLEDSFASNNRGSFVSDKKTTKQWGRKGSATCFVEFPDLFFLFSCSRR